MQATARREPIFNIIAGKISKTKLFYIVEQKRLAEIVFFDYIIYSTQGLGYLLFSP